jgi:anti-sigma factor RsiW
MSDPQCEQLDEYLCGGLPSGEAADFEAHLAACPACREQSAVQRQIDRLLAEGTAGIEPVPISLPGRIERGVRAARRRRLLAWAGAAAAAAGIMFVLGLWGVQNVFLPRGVADPVAQRPADDRALSKTFAQMRKAPPLQGAGVGPAPVPSPAPPQPQAAARVSVTLVDSSSAILVPVETQSPNVTLVCIYPTVKVHQEEDQRSQ